jgi:predicted nucleic acid-binding protein
VPFVAFLDACVLYPACLRDVLLTVAEAGICQIRWSDEVLGEMERNIAKRTTAQSVKEAAAGAKYTRNEMERMFPEAMVPRASYDRLIPVMTNDAKDRHVLAAAVAARADVLVTFNTRHFRSEACQPYIVDVQDPDTFLMHQFELDPDGFLNGLQFLAEQRSRPPMDTVGGILTALQRSVPRFADQARQAWDQWGGRRAAPTK